tara:strand:- start:3 stop:497 length:495 start_codon:yes stop_codon:yes gene_type:complete
LADKIREIERCQFVRTVRFVYNYLLDMVTIMFTSIVMARTQLGKKDGLTYKQRALVDTLVATGCTITEASQKAGYSKGESGRVVASRTLRLPKVQAYLQQEVSNKLGLGSVHASSTLLHLIQNGKSEYVRLEASKDLLDRIGMRAPDKVQHQVAGNISINIDLD